jgi:DNA polymerase III alpha subunit (gram-positive type)
MDGYRNEFIVYDLETGGLNEEKNAMVEVGFLALDWDLNEVAEYSRVIKPYDENLTYVPEAMLVNKITQKDLEGGDEAKDVAKEIVDFLESSKKRSKRKPVMCGHNILSFDNKFLRKFMNDFKFDVDKLAELNGIDTMWWARFKFPELVNYKLGTVADYLSLMNKSAHTSEADTRVTADLVKIFLRALRGEGVAMQTKNTVERKREKFQF